MDSFAPIEPIPVDYSLKCDASKKGWGVSIPTSVFNGRWSLETQENHINYLELLCIKYAIFSIASDKHKHNSNFFRQHHCHSIC